jgi:hypothetical protein
MDLEQIKNKRIFELSFDEIYYLYITLNYTQTDISKLINTHSSNVSRKLKKEKIKKDNFRETQSIKQRKSDIKITQNMLKNDYPKLSITEISKKYNSSNGYIYNLLKKYNINIVKGGFFQKKYCKDNNPILKKITKELLYKKYIIEELPAHVIGNEFGVDKNYIYRRLKEFGIKIRDKKEAFNTTKNKSLRKKILSKNIGVNLTSFKPPYNKNSISILESFAKKYNLNLQHAENGGEFFIKRYNYWVDGYDESKNIVVEYYEKQHKYRAHRDEKRISKIKNHLKCKIYIIHYNGFIEEI